MALLFRWLKGVIGCGLAVGLSSCQIKEAELDRGQNALKPRSLQPWRGRAIHGMPAERYALAALARVLPRNLRVKIREVSRAADSAIYEVRFQMEAPSQPGMAGSAFPVSPDGYFLTAAHVCESGPINVMFSDEKKRLVVRPARVVWLGDYSAGGPDLALLHAPLRPILMAPLAAWDDPSTFRRQPVLASGWGARAPESMGKGVAGGRLLKAWPPRTDSSGARWKDLRHTTPFASGDSGGPLLNARGEALGVNASMMTFGIVEVFGKKFTPGTYSESVSPDPAWIASLIAQDRARRRRP